MQVIKDLTENMDTIKENDLDFRKRKERVIIESLRDLTKILQGNRIFYVAVRQFNLPQQDSHRAIDTENAYVLLHKLCKVLKNDSDTTYLTKSKEFLQARECLEDYSLDIVRFSYSDLKKG